MSRTFHPVPRRADVAELAADYTNATTSYTTALSLSFTPAGTSVLVTLSGCGTNGSTAFSFFRLKQGATTKAVGSRNESTGALQWFFGGTRKFTGLTPGTAYTFEAEARVDGNTFYCRPATQSEKEFMTLKVEDSL